MCVWVVQTNHQLETIKSNWAEEEGKTKVSLSGFFVVVVPPIALEPLAEVRSREEMLAP